jgi:hypothetical protein
MGAYEGVSLTCDSGPGEPTWKHVSEIYSFCRRKNIGYLWAIAHGAKVIYETDDDNLLTTDAIPVLEPGYYANYIVDSSRRTVNVYDTYGLPNMWPRGLPLSDVKTRAPTTFMKRFSLPLIQQGATLLWPHACSRTACIRSN